MTRTHALALALSLLASPLLAAGREVRELHALLDEAWEQWMADAPTWASTLGDRRYNDRWPDLGPAARARQQVYRRELLERLGRIDRARLPPAEAINHDLFRRRIEEDVEDDSFRLELIPLNQRGGIQTEDELGLQLRFTVARDYEDWIARLRRLGVLVDQTIELMQEGIRIGMVHPRVIMERVPAQIANQVVEDPERSPFYRPFQKMSAELPAAEQERLREAARAAIREVVVPAYRRFQVFFSSEYLPACRADVGAWALPRGAELYAAQVRHYTTTRLTAEEIHAIGLEEVARIRGEMDRVIRDVGFEGDFAAFLHFLRTDPRFYYKTGEELLAAYREISKRADPELTRLFGRLPRMPYGVRPIPMEAAADTTTAYYSSPSADGLRAGTYWVNLYRPEVRPRYEMEALSLHEAVPGHHLQIALAQELGDLPRFRRYTGYTAFAEGWGLYAESLGGEMGFYQDPYSRFGQLTYEMWRAVRLVVDTGMHARKWDRDRAIEYFKANAAKSEHDIVNEIDRYIAWPGQALAYKIGERKIQELRGRARAALGERFDLRAFHDTVLGSGAIPLDVLERNVEAWIAARQAALGAAPAAASPRPRPARADD